MSLRSNYVNLHIQSSCNFPNKNLSFLRGTHQIRQFRVWRRRRLKFDQNKLSSSSSSSSSSSVRNQLGPVNSLSLDNFFHSLISQFPSVNSLDLIAPALGFASGVALYLSRLNSDRGLEQEEEVFISDSGEWILFTSPTPFNRFVMLRCPSISFPGSSELLEDVNEKLVKEDRHFVELNSGRIQVRDLDGKNGDANFEEKLVFQRVCVSTDDGGVVSLDWPVHLDLTEEHGMDTTLLLVPGTAEGSTDKNVRSLVLETLRRGCFPVVMNPRGCAGSPLTTPRLFTAADSDDICTAIQFINRARPWTTLMGVGWGYGANMLTKYLAEVGERTPLTAATCIDNPFDLEEATRSPLHHIALDQKLSKGLKDILQSNKELFQGRAKGFNVEKALSAKTLRDFDQAISMVSYGYEAIEDFYSKSSTRELVDNVKIPVLFIQASTDNGTVPPFSIPRSSIAENPFTSLLLCSCLPSSIIISERSALSWCQDLAIEWLTAVELGLLKGRHPLLKDVDVTINPSKGLSLVEGRPSDENKNSHKIFNFTQSHALKKYALDPIEDTLEESDRGANVRLRSQRNSPESQQEGNSDMSEQSSSVDAELVKEEGNNPIDNEGSQVLQTAQVVMNMLDVTMPGTLAQEQKKKVVLTAMEQGETLLKALQGAVPEDVRGKLTAAVSEIVQSQGTKLNLDGIMNVGRITNESSELKVKIQETFRGPSHAAGGSNDVHSPELMNRGDEMSDGNGKNLYMELEQDHGKGEVSKDMATQSSGYDETGSGEGSKSDQNSKSEDAVDTDNVASAQVRVNQDNTMAQVTRKEGNDIQNTDGKSMDDSTDQKQLTPTTKTEESLSPVTSSPEPPLMEKEGNDIQKSEDKNIVSLADQNKQTSTKTEESSPTHTPASNPPPISVTQALDALTGFDDSTQMAVNTVFGVLENMIAQLEDNEENEHENGGEQDKHYDEEPGSSSEEFPISGETEKKSVSEGVANSELSLDSDVRQLHNHPINSCYEKFAYLHEDAENGSFGKQLTQNCTSSVENNGSSHGNNKSGHVDKDKDERREKDLIDPKKLAKSSDKVGQLHKIPLCVTLNPYGDSLYNEYLRKYLISKISSPKSLDLDSTTDLLLDYFPEEGQWKLLDKPGDNRDSVNNIRTNFSAKGQRIHFPLHGNDTDQIIETSYVILDTEDAQQPLEDYKTVDDLIRKLDGRSPRSEELVCLIKTIILDSLKVEVGRRLGVADVKEMESGLACDLERVADAVSLGIGHNKDILGNKDPASGKVGTLHGEYIIKTISSALEDASSLRTVLPVGVSVGSSLAALRKYFDVATHNDNHPSKENVLDQTSSSREKFYCQVSEIGSDHQLLSKKYEYSKMDNFISGASENPGTLNLSKDAVMVGAVTAALGASAFLVPEQKEERYKNDETTEISSRSFSGKANHHKEHDKLDDAISDKNHNNLVCSLAEKAMSVAAPVVPTKSGGEVDQDRLVAMLADLGQKGGMLKLIGKIALLWGGLRGAMSLTDRLILFLHISERPLLQRILGFVCMVLVLWSPVVIPLFPTFVQSWSAHKSTGMAVYACIVGLYTAVMILITLWGKRIRGYKNPLEQYGLDLTSFPKLHDFAKGLIGGVMLVLSIHFINALLGCANISWPSSLSSSAPDAMVWLKVYGGLLILAGRGIVTAIVVAIVEELFFRSWLPEEIAVDLGYHRAVIISGLAFAVLQRSLRAIPGLWLLSFALSGARQRNSGSLAIPIGMRAGILATCFILQTGGFLIYHQNYPLWLTGTHPLQPFSGAVGLTFSLLLAVLLYQRQPTGTRTETITSVIRE
ncbi:CAAX amino terminal protease [Macleaya cordata]|uniref:CAAX amino terminal protease n=1 Tax=Macleaya cordata TaxID=56857 RepID=A0A200QCV4_MACCD|nr:CAAX amino terminal protease [Macleaya cordata]